MLRTAHGCALLALAGLLLAFTADAQKPVGPTSDTAAGGRVRSALNLPIQEAELAGGLRVVMSVNRDTPTVAVCSTYDVGVRNEGPAAAGYVHLLEQMMLRPEQQPALIASRGGTTWSHTGWDQSTFCTVVSSGELELGLWAETQRMKATPITPRTIQARRQRAANARRGDVAATGPGAGAYRLYGLALQGYRVYEPDPGSVVRSIPSNQYQRLRSFFVGHYRPERVVFSVAGDIDTDTTVRLLREQLAGVAAVGRAKDHVAPPLPRQTSERFMAFEQRHTRTPVVHFGWVIPPVRTAEHRALQLAAAVLGGGDGSLLDRDLVGRRRLAKQVRAWTGTERGPSLLIVRAVLAPHSTVKQLQSALDAQLRRLRNAGPSAEQLAAAKARTVSALLLRLQSNLERAKVLGQFELQTGDARRLGGEYDAFAAVSPADVRGALARYVGDMKRTVVAAYQPGWHESVTGSMQRFHIVHSGETLTSIAKRYRTTIKALATLNQLNPAKPIFPGQKLKVPDRPRGKGGVQRQGQGSSQRTAGARSTETAKSAKGSTQETGQRSARGKARAKSKPRTQASPARPSQPTATRKSRATRKPAAKTQPQPRTHVVRQHQTLSGIARRYGVSLRALVRANGINPKRPLQIGQRLMIPAKR